MDILITSADADTATKPFDVALLLAALERSLPVGAEPSRS